MYKEQNANSVLSTALNSTPSAYPHTNNNMIISKTISRKRSSSNENEDPEHPVVRLFRAIPDPNKYKLKPLPQPSQKRQRIDHRGHVNRVSQLIKSMREDFPMPGSATPSLRNRSYSQPGNSVFSAQINAPSTPRLNGVRSSLLGVNHGGRIVACGTAHRSKQKKAQVLTEDPLGSDPEGSSESAPSDTDDENTPPQSSVCVRSDKGSTRTYLTTRGTQTLNLISTATQTANTMSIGTQTQMPRSFELFELPPITPRRPLSQRQCVRSPESPRMRRSESPSFGANTSSFDPKTPSFGPKTPCFDPKTPSFGPKTPSFGSKTPFKFNPLRGGSHPWQTEMERSHTPSGDSLHDQSAPRFSASTPFSFQPVNSTPSARWGSALSSPADLSSSTSSGRTIAEERILMSLCMKRKEHTKFQEFGNGYKYFEE